MSATSTCNQRPEPFAGVAPKHLRVEVDALDLVPLCEQCEVRPGAVQATSSSVLAPGLRSAISA